MNPRIFQFGPMGVGPAAFGPAGPAGVDRVGWGGAVDVTEE